MTWRNPWSLKKSTKNQFTDSSEGLCTGRLVLVIVLKGCVRADWYWLSTASPLGRTKEKHSHFVQFRPFNSLFTPVYKTVKLVSSMSHDFRKDRWIFHNSTETMFCSYVWSEVNFLTHRESWTGIAAEAIAAVAFQNYAKTSQNYFSVDVDKLKLNRGWLAQSCSHLHWSLFFQLTLGNKMA